MADIYIPDKPKAAIKEIEVGEIMYTTLECEHIAGCGEVHRIAFSTIDADGKVKKDKKDKIKKDYYDTIPTENMPDPEHPEIWYCDKHKGS